MKQQQQQQHTQNIKNNKNKNSTATKQNFNSVDFGRFLSTHIAAETNPFVSKDSSSNPSNDSMFKSKEFFSDLYRSQDWELSSEMDLPVNTNSFTTVCEVSSSITDCEEIPKLFGNTNWDADLSPDAVRATAEALAEQSSLITPPLHRVPSATGFGDALKSHDWSILPGAIDNGIEYSPNMLEEKALSSEKFVPVDKKPTVPDIFTSSDWVISEILGTHKDVSLAPDMFYLDEPAPEVGPTIPESNKTDWGSMFMQQLAPRQSSPEPSVREELKSAKKRKRKKRKKVVPDHKEYVKVSQLDVLLGRGGKSNHHPGNKRYREEVENLRPVYAGLVDDKQKTEMSQVLVDVIEQLGGRFLEEDKAKDELGTTISLGWYVVPNIVARRKASQALREDNDPEKRKAKRARFLAKKATFNPMK